MIDVTKHPAMIPILEALKGCMVPLPDGSAGFYVSAFTDHEVSEGFSVRYRESGSTLFVSSPRVSHEAYDLLYNVPDEIDADEAGAAAVVVTYRRSNGLWWAGAAFGCEAQRWRSGPENYDDLAAKVFPMATHPA